MPDYRGFLHAPQIHYAAEQPRPLATGQDTATNRRSFSGDIYRIDIQEGHPSLPLAPTPVGAERSGTADLPSEVFRSHH